MLLSVFSRGDPSNSNFCSVSELWIFFLPTRMRFLETRKNTAHGTKNRRSYIYLSEAYTFSRNPHRTPSFLFQGTSKLPFTILNHNSGRAHTGVDLQFFFLVHPPNPGQFRLSRRLSTELKRIRALFHIFSATQQLQTVAVLTTCRLGVLSELAVGERPSYSSWIEVSVDRAPGRGEIVGVSQKTSSLFCLYVCNAYFLFHLSCSYVRIECGDQLVWT